MIRQVQYTDMFSSPNRYFLDLTDCSMFSISIGWILHYETATCQVQVLFIRVAFFTSNCIDVALKRSPGLVSDVGVGE